MKTSSEFKARDFIYINEEIYFFNTSSLALLL